jgi:hypothetical protein
MSREPPPREVPYLESTGGTRLAFNFDEYK